MGSDYPQEDVVVGTTPNVETKTWQKFGLIVGGLAVALLILLGTDYLLGLILPRMEPGKYLPAGRRESREGSPAYDGFSWYDSDFLDESFANHRWKEFRYQPHGIVLGVPQDYHGKYFNVDNGYRRTVNPSSVLINPIKILVVGGSTVWSSESPDALTLPSLIAEALHVKFADLNFVITNIGVSSSSSYQELLRVIYEIKIGNIPDLLIVYNGVNDAVYGTYYANEAATLYEQYRNMKESTSKLASIKRFIASTSLARAFLSMELSYRGNARITAEQYLRNMQMLQSIAEMYGFDLYMFLQPHLFSGKRLTETEEKLALGNQITWPGMKYGLLAGYATISNRMKVWKHPRFFDMKSEFDSVESDLFLDYCHISPKGNRLIAKSIVDHILHLPTKHGDSQ
jgi:lysophospholipase L1-like esterase